MIIQIQLNINHLKSIYKYRSQIEHSGANSDMVVSSKPRTEKYLTNEKTYYKSNLLLELKDAVRLRVLVNDVAVMVFYSKLILP